MSDCVAPFLTVSPQLVAAVAEACAVRDPVGHLEKLVVSGQIESLPLFLSEKWRHFRAEARQVFERNDCVVLQGFPTANDGSALLIAALTIGDSLRTYRDGKVIKQFKMSPWTTELSHTTRAGEFHTDLNVEPSPPGHHGHTVPGARSREPRLWDNTSRSTRPPAGFRRPPSRKLHPPLPPRSLSHNAERPFVGGTDRKNSGEWRHSLSSRNVAGRRPAFWRFTPGA